MGLAHFSKRKKTTEGIELLNLESMGTLTENGNYKYLRILEANFK